MSEPKVQTTTSVLTQALANENKVIADRNVAKVQAEMSVISHHRAEIAKHEAEIAKAQKNIREYDAVLPLTAKQVLGNG